MRKNVILEKLGEVLDDQHFYLAENVEDVTVRTNLLIFFDEATFAGNHRQVEQLKSQVTGKKRRMNEKYQPGYKIDNHTNVVFCSNGRATKVEAQDRRNLCLDCEGKFAGRQKAQTRKRKQVDVPGQSQLKKTCQWSFQRSK